MNWNEFKATNIGEEPDCYVPSDFFSHTCGAVAWPGKLPGFAIVIGAARDDGNLYVLAEFESWDMRELAIQSKALDHNFGPNSWVADTERTEVAQLLYELDKDSVKPFNIGPLQSWLLEAKEPYHPILSTIRTLGKTGRKKLVLRDSIVRNSINEIKADMIYELRFGDYPAIEALAFAVMEAEQLVESERNDYYDDDEGVQECDLLSL